MAVVVVLLGRGKDCACRCVGADAARLESLPSPPSPRLEHGASAPSLRTLLQSPCIRYHRHSPSLLVPLVYALAWCSTPSLGAPALQAPTPAQLNIARALPVLGHSNPPQAPACPHTHLLHLVSSLPPRPSARCAASGSPAAHPERPRRFKIRGVRLTSP